MSFKSLRIVTLLISTLLLSLTSTAHNKVAVVPLIGSGSELKPIPLIDVVSNQKQITDSQILTFPQIDAKTAIVITSITVTPDKYPPANLGNLTIKLERCRRKPPAPQSSCRPLVSVPNNKPTTIDFGIGFSLGHGQLAHNWIKIVDRGGISTAHVINVYVSAYRFVY